MDLVNFLFYYCFLPEEICTGSVYRKEPELFSLCMEWEIALQAYPHHQPCKDASFTASATTPTAVPTNGGSGDRYKRSLAFNSNTSHPVAF